MKGKYYNNFLHEQSINCIRLGLQWDNKHSKVSLQIFLLSKGKYNSITPKFALFTDLGSLIVHSVEIYFSATDFTSNQYWLISEGQKLSIYQFFGKFNFKKSEISKCSKFRAALMVKMAVFMASNDLNWFHVKSERKNFYQISTLCPILLNAQLCLIEQKISHR